MKANPLHTPTHVRLGDGLIFPSQGTFELEVIPEERASDSAGSIADTQRRTEAERGATATGVTGEPTTGLLISTAPTGSSGLRLLVVKD